MEKYVGYGIDVLLNKGLFYCLIIGNRSLGLCVAVIVLLGFKKVYGSVIVVLGSHKLRLSIYIRLRLRSLSGFCDHSTRLISIIPCGLFDRSPGGL